MTRVEKYRRYREDIANMKVETFSSKKKVVDKIEKGEGKKVGYENVMDIHDIYDNGHNQPKKRRTIRIKKYQIIYCSIAILIIAIILFALILVGINLWGN